ncbi:MAG: hypothetical protein FD134_1984 [Gallionellaceae bacterium]|nr:MAG: hypothetical protein FD134_1984 [Gallionellaceae bacterium]
MKLLRIATTGIFAASLYGTAFAGDANPIEMARQVGFVGCDSLIGSTFEQALKSSDRRFSVNYFDETAKTSIDLLVTFGKTGDTVWQTAHFEKNGGYCYSVVQSMIAEEGNCAGLLNKDQYFKYEDDSAGALWSKNKGGVTKLFIQSSNSCNQIFVQSDKQKIAK